MYYTLTNSSLAFILEGPEQVAALRAKVVIELSDITNMEWMDVFAGWNKWLIRLPGTYMPKMIMAGSYWSEEGWEFVYAKKPKGFSRPILHDVLVIRTNKDRYSRLVIETTKENAQEMINWWKDKTK